MQAARYDFDHHKLYKKSLIGEIVNEISSHGEISVGRTLGLNDPQPS